MKVIHQLAEYLFLRKKSNTEPSSDMLKYMHGINRFSILMFVIAMLVLVTKALIRSIL